MGQYVVNLKEKNLKLGVKNEEIYEAKGKYPAYFKFKALGESYNHIVSETLLVPIDQYINFGDQIQYIETFNYPAQWKKFEPKPVKWTGIIIDSPAYDHVYVRVETKHGPKSARVHVSKIISVRGKRIQK